MTKIIWEIPLRTVSEANLSEHWTKKSKRHKQQQFFIRSLFAHEAQEIPIPCVVKVTRLIGRYGRFMDEDDNLRMAFKYIKDEISECIFPEKRKSYMSKKGKLIPIKGRADDTPLIKWEYAQEKSRIMGIRIEITAMEE